MFTLTLTSAKPKSELTNEKSEGTHVAWRFNMLTSTHNTFRREFVLETDHQALTWLERMKTAE